MPGPSDLPPRTEADSIGPLDIPAGNYWGVQTLRSTQNFPFTSPAALMPHEIIVSQCIVKKCAAQYNKLHGKLSATIADAIITVADEVISNSADIPLSQFPLTIYQTGSGTQTNMNCNEVLAARATHILSKFDATAVGNKDSPHFVHPNDHVNMGQSSNDSFPTAMHIACATALLNVTIPGLTRLWESLKRKSEEYDNVIKIGRTHCQDATPLTFGQVSNQSHSHPPPHMHVWAPTQ